MSNIIKFPSKKVNGSNEPTKSDRPIRGGFFFLEVDILENDTFRYQVDVSTNDDEHVCNIIEGLLVKMANNLSPKVRIHDLETGENNDLDS